MIIVAYIGTSDIEIIESELIPFIDAIKKANAAWDVELAFTAMKNIHQLTKKGLHIHCLKEVIDIGINQGYEEIQILPLHLVAGENYQEMNELVHFYNQKSSVVLLELLLESEESCHEFLQVLYEILSPIDSEKQVLIVGHGASGDTNQGYDRLKQQLLEEKLNGDLVDLRQNREEILQKLGKNPADEVILFPLFVTAGYHVKKDVLEGQGSIKSVLEVSGFKVKAYTKGLLSYDVVKNLYINKINRK